MPQIWLTYDELGDYFGCSPERARADAVANGSDRRRCHDGLTRVKLRPATAVAFIERIAANRECREIARLNERIRELESLTRRDPVGTIQATLALAFSSPITRSQPRLEAPDRPPAMPDRRVA